MTTTTKIIIILPAYNAEKTLKKVYQDIPKHVINNIVLVDDNSNDNTLDIAKKLNINHVIKHNKRIGYGGNQKTCLTKAINLGGDIVIMIHPDYQYSPKLIPAFINLIESNHYDMVLGSRILGGTSVKNGMPIYKYIFNRLLTLFQNIILRQKISEYHTGFRAYKRSFLLKTNWAENSNSFIFDNEIILQMIWKNARIGEISCPTKYDKHSSSINITQSIIYGLGIVKNTILYVLHELKIINWRKLK